MNIADENLLEQCYDFLCANPTCTKRLIGLPPHKRWNKLCKMISGARRQRVGPRVSVDLNQNIEYIPEQPEWTGYRDPTPPSPPPSVDEYSPGQTQSVPSVPSGSKRKAPMVDVIDSQFDKLTTSLDGFANVLSSSNVHFGVISDASMDSRIIDELQKQINQSRTLSASLERHTQAMKRRISLVNARIQSSNPTTEEIENLLRTMNIEDQNSFRQCFNFLSSHSSHTRRLIEMPIQYRFNRLQRYITEASTEALSLVEGEIVKLVCDCEAGVLRGWCAYSTLILSSIVKNTLVSVKVNSFIEGGTSGRVECETIEIHEGGDVSVEGEGVEVDEGTNIVVEGKGTKINEEVDVVVKSEGVEISGEVDVVVEGEGAKIDEEVDVGVEGEGGEFDEKAGVGVEGEGIEFHEETDVGMEGESVDNDEHESNENVAD
ncbi:uncharacterized protein HKW66_Vig0242680 [Vigna angularis]|uniref:Uncharacterized protein n=1 Tax=Phaseolus angularis TaxID=3914 RepID=A0A8T0JL48_PHAAN|nr:uncharacterized protein HKW66_Vig0242680 [Vigna angularis]